MKAWMKTAAVLCLAVLTGWPMAAPAENTYSLPLVRPADFAGQESLVRIVNLLDTPGAVEITAIDDTGQRFGPVTLTLGALQAVNLTSGDLANGKEAKGLPVGIGSDGRGSWRLELVTDLAIEPLAYIRTPDGFLSSMHDVAPYSDFARWVPIFNPGLSTSHESSLRIINRSTTEAEVTITGRDDAGNDASGTVSLMLPAGAARTLEARELEQGGAGLNGRLGDAGEGMWQLYVDSWFPIEVMSLLSTRTGRLANLSTKWVVRGATPHKKPPYTLVVSPPGLSAFGESLVRIINRSDVRGTVQMTAFDVRSWSRGAFGSATLTLDPNQAVNLTAGDLENGNAGKGLPGGVGTDWVGRWLLVLDTEVIAIEPLNYFQSSDGLLTSMHDVAPVSGGSHWVPFFNPGSNTSKISYLEIINPGPTEAEVTVKGRDDAGKASGTVSLTVFPRSSKPVAAQDLENLDQVLDWGSLGDGAGKWRLHVSSSADVRVKSKLVATETGHWVNLSTAPAYKGRGAIGDAVAITPGESVAGDLSSTADEDYFRLPLDGPGAATATFWTTGEADTAISLFDGNGYVLSSARASAADDGAVVAYSSGGRVSVKTDLRDVYARVTGREGGNTGSYNLHNEVAENRAPRLLQTFNPLTVEAGGAAVSVDLSAFFFDPDGDDLSFGVRVEGGTIGPFSLGLEISGSVLSVTSPANIRPGPVTLSVTASDPWGLVAVEVLSVTVQPGDILPPEPPPEPPVGVLDACVTAKVQALPYIYPDRSRDYRATMTNSCDFGVNARNAWNPKLRGEPGWGVGGSIRISAGGTGSSRVFQRPSRPRFRFCVYDEGSHGSGRRCYGALPRWQYE